MRAEGPSGEAEEMRNDGPIQANVAEGRPEGRSPRGRSGRRERGPRNENAAGEANADGQAPGAEGHEHLAASATPDQAADQQATGDNAEARNNGEGREKRSRDRYGRDRGGRGDRAPRGDRSASDETLQDGEAAPVQMEFNAGVMSTADQSPAATVAAAAPAAPVASAAPVAAPVAAAQAVAPVAVAATVPAARMPAVETYVLPQDDLQQVAVSSGLQWVNTDPQRVAAVQALIAAEPAPVHTPRERTATVVVEEGPLVLVETRRDLRPAAADAQHQATEAASS